MLQNIFLLTFPIIEQQKIYSWLANLTTKWWQAVFEPRPGTGSVSYLVLRIRDYSSAGAGGGEKRSRGEDPRDYKTKHHDFVFHKEENILY